MNNKECTSSPVCIKLLPGSEEMSGGIGHLWIVVSIGGRLMDLMVVMVLSRGMMTMMVDRVMGMVGVVEGMVGDFTPRCRNSGR